MRMQKYLICLLLIIPVRFSLANAPVKNLTGITFQMVSPLSREITGDTAFIFDDGSCEDGWAINPGYLGWFGNLFPLTPGTSGTLKSVQLYFLENPNGRDQQLSVSLFSESGYLIGSSASFTATAGSWITVNVSSLPFSGPFYVMVKWDNIVQGSHWLGLDTNGPYADQNLARYFDGSTFQALSDVVGCNPGSFLVRATAVTNPAGVGDIIQNGAVAVWPNPAGDWIYILSEKKMKSVAIFDLHGKILIKSNPLNEEKLMLDLSGLSSGLHLMKITTVDGIFSEKISVIH